MFAGFFFNTGFINRRYRPYYNFVLASLPNSRWDLKPSIPERIWLRFRGKPVVAVHLRPHISYQIQKTAHR